MTDPMVTRINILAIPGIRDSFVTDRAADRTRDYSQAIYLMDIPSYTDGDVRIFDGDDLRPNVEKTRAKMDSRAVDNNYAAAYFPDVSMIDDRNGNPVKVPASIAALAALGFNDSVAYPWFAPAGFNRAALSNVVNVATRLNSADRDNLYDSRVNPIASFPQAGFVIFGQKTLQQARSALDRVNVRRMLLEVKRLVSSVATKLVFEQNTPGTRAKFISQVTPLLATIQSQQGVDQFRVIMDDSNNTVDDVESNRLNGRIVLVPTRAVEFIAIDFIITNSGVSFE
jgi:phage tail sheath protein FI